MFPSGPKAVEARGWFGGKVAPCRRVSAACAPRAPLCAGVRCAQVVRSWDFPPRRLRRSGVVFAARPAAGKGSRRRAGGARDKQGAVEHFRKLHAELPKARAAPEKDKIGGSTPRAAVCA
eukprot:1908613-Alexandrium_andersonii.AAC.1